jgi:uncharacterized protein YeeX (DUF496 family)
MLRLGTVGITHLNNKPMEITNETKIKELIPKGYEVGANITYITHENFNNIQIPELRIQLKKKPVKDFEWYIDEYIMHNQLLSEPHRNYKKRFKDKDFEAIPFELRIGLLKFICDDNKYGLPFVLSHIDKYDDGDPLLEHCPKKFLDSLFK